MRIELTEVDGWIRQGQGARAREALQLLCERKIPYELLGKACNLAWRANDPLLGIRILNPIIRPTHRRVVDASDEQRAEYAACLTKIGANQEAIRLLQSLSNPEAPSALLYRSFALLTDWNYAAAIPLLLQYLNAPEIDGYQRLVGMANLAAGLVFTKQYGQAREILLELIKETTEQGHRLLLGTAQELKAASLVLQGRQSEARSFLSAAGKSLAESGSRHEFFAKKWLAISTFLETPRNEAAIEGIRTISQEAKEKELWESVRDCDRFIAIGLNNQELFSHLFFGTPFRSYREKLIEEAGPEPFRSANYIWRIFPGPNPISIDLVAKAHSTEGRQLPFRVLNLLASDFYRPFRLATLHAHLYPKEFFNPVTSPKQVHEAMRRLRRWFESEKVPLEVSERAGFYQLRATAPIQVIVANPDEKVKPETSMKLKEFLDRLPKGVFSVNDLPGTSRRTTLRHLKETCSQGLVEKQGSGKNTKYRKVG